MPHLPKHILATFENMCLRFLLFLLLFMQGSFSLYGQNYATAPYFKGYQSFHSIYHWTTSNGLPQSHVTGIVQSKNKLIWVATHDGVVHFDGKRFIPTRRTYGQREFSPFITTIYAKGDTIYWTSHHELVGYYNNQVITCIPFIGDNPQIQEIREHRGELYLISPTHVYRLEERKIFPIVDISREPKGSFLAGSVFQDDHLLYLFRSGNRSELHKLVLKTGRTSKQQLDRSYRWLASCSGKPTLYDGTAWRQIEHNGTFTLYDRTDLTSFGTFTDSKATGPQLLYYNEKHVVLTLPSVSRQMAVIETDNILYGDEILTTLYDHAGNVWIGSGSYGLFMFRRYPFEVFNTINNKPIVNSSHAFYDNAGVIWFDNGRNQTFGYNLKDKQLRYQIEDVSHTVDADWSADTLCFFSITGRHNWWSRKTGKLSPIEGLGSPVNVIERSGPREFILGTTGALLKWDGQRVRTLKSFKSPQTNCNQILRISAEEYYFATSEGLYHLKDKHWKLITIPGRPNIKDFRCVVLLRDRPYAIIGTAGYGLIRYNTKTGKLMLLPEIPSVLTNAWSIIEDRFGQLWITSNNGILQVYIPDLMNFYDGRFTGVATNRFRFEHGIQNVEFNSRTQNKGILLPNGDILFSSLGGPVIIHPYSNVLFNKVLSSIFIDQITIDNEIEEWPDSGKITIREGQFVRVRFSLPSYSSERVLNFEYRIKGYRNYWSSISNSYALLDNLPSGNYTLEIQLNSGQRKLSVPVHVAAKNPNAWILFALLGICASALIALITYLITRTVQRRKHSINNLKQQLRLLETEALRAQMNPHFIFNCLNTIQFLFISGNIDRANKYLSDFSSLMRKTLELLRLQVTTLTEELEITGLYIELEQLQFDASFEYRLINRLQTPLDQIQTPTLIFQIFVENAIVHGLKKTAEPNPVLTLILDETDHSYVFRLCDNGPGITEKRKVKHESRGLSILRERFDVMGELYNWNIDFVLHERKPMEDDIRTEIIITLDKKLIEARNDEHTDS